MASNWVLIGVVDAALLCPRDASEKKPPDDNEFVGEGAFETNSNDNVTNEQI